MKTMNCTTIALALLLAAGTTQAVWIGATSATTDNDLHEYTNTNNWENFVIDDVITNTFTSATTLYFKKDHATGPNGLDIRNKSSDLSLKTSGGTYWLTLNGDVNHTDSTKALMLYVPIKLGGVPRVFNEATSGFIQWYGSITNGTVVKTGSGVIRASSGTLYFNAPVVVNKGTLYPYQTAVNYDVPTVLNNAGLLFYGGALRNTPSITLNAITGGSTLTSQAYVNGENRLGDSVYLILNSAASGSSTARAVVTHQIDATTGIDVAERIGRIVLRSGESAMVQGSRNSGSAVFFRLDAGELVRENKSTLTINNTKNIGDSVGKRNAQLGMRREIGDVDPCGNQFFLDTPPEMIGGPISRGTDGPIIPYILGVNVVSNDYNGTLLNTLMTYDAAGGMRAMRVRTDLLGNPSEFVATLAATDADGKDNVRIGANESFSSEKTVNALALYAGTLTLGAGARVTLGSGLLAFVGGTLSASDTSVIDAGAREGIVFNAGGKTINASLAGTGGYTFSTFNGTVKLTGTNSYSGQTTIVSGTLNVYRLSGIPHNVALPDDGLVLIHPGATLEVGYYQSDYATREIIGALAGGGRVRLGWISGGAYPRSLVIGAGGTGVIGEITLDGGTISPGMPGDVGMLSVINESNAAGKPIPVTFKNGALDVDLTAPGFCDLLSTLTNVNINAAGDLGINVNVSGFSPKAGQEWTIITSESGPIADGNGGKLFNTVTDNSDRVNFTAAIAPDGKSVVLTAIDANPGSVIMVR